MIPKSNFHTHTYYCDGVNKPEEIVLEAISKGFIELGFSGHSYTPFDLRYCMSQESTEKYLYEINILKEKYKDYIKIHCGIEVDYYSTVNKKDFDYIIGSVHYIEKNGIFYDVDDSKSDFISHINNAWDGDVYSFIEDYYSLVGDVVNKTDCDIIGHFDLVRKFNTDSSLFSENHPRYATASESAIKKLLKTNKVFEINTGAIGRGYMSSPYPSSTILRLLKGRDVVISSDCHEKSALDCWFDNAYELANKNSLYILYSLKEIKD